MHPLRIAASLVRVFMTLAALTWAVATFTFVLMRAIPGGPLSADRQLPPPVRAAIEARYHLNDPLWRQYARYLADAACFRFGPSYTDPGHTVGEIIGQRWGVSAVLGALSLGLAMKLRQKP
ncbi:MAG: ABC transporter permease, partial [bacterium]|nr:ABC transporter permease [bacterium]